MNILFVTEYSPFETNFGAQQRSHHLHRALLACGDVSTVLLRQDRAASAGEPQDSRLLVEATYRLAPLGWGKFSPDPRLGAALAPYVDFARYDLVCARYLGPVSKLVLPRGLPVMVDLDDVGYTYPDTGPLIERFKAMGKAMIKHALERRAMRRYPRFFFLSDRDRARFQHLPGAVLPNIPVMPTTHPDVQATGNTILFVGAMWYGPNRQGVEWFLAHCWPAIRASAPDAELLIAGAAADDVRAAWSAQPGVSAPGFVPDLAATYAVAAFTIVPVFSGGGTNIKVLESLAYARACVTTPFCARGFVPQLKADKDLVVAATAGDTIAQCLRLLRNPAVRTEFALAGHASVVKHYSFEAFGAVVGTEVEAAIRSPRSGF